MALLDFITNNNPEDVERRLRLAQGLAGMSHSPNVGLQQSIAGRLQDVQAQRQQQAALSQLEKQTAMAQQLLGDKFPMLSGALQAGIMSPTDAVMAARQGGDTAPALIQQYNLAKNEGYTGNFMDYQTDLKKAGATNVTQTVSGGDTMTAGRKKVDEAYAKDFLEWKQGGGSDMIGQIAQVGNVLAQLEAGKSLTGPAIGTLGSYSPLMLSIINPEAANAKEQVEEVVQRNLRIILGAQFTEKEGERLISRAYNPALPPSQNAARLRKLFLQMRTAAEQRDGMADYFTKNGTLIGYQGEQPSINDFYVALSGLSVGQVVKGYKFLGGDSTVRANWQKVD